MKKFILAAVAATLVASPAMAAAPQDHRGQQTHQSSQNHRSDFKQNGAKQNDNGRPGMRQQAYKPAPVQYRNDWRKGQRFDSRYARNYREIDYRQHRGLKAPPRGYRYVQSDNDVVLVAIASGVIGAVFANLLR